MDLSVKQGLPFGQTCDLLVIPLPKGAKVSKWLDVKIAAQVDAEGFEGGLGEWLCLPTYGLMKAKKIALLGMGERGSFETDLIRRAGAMLLKRAKEAKAKSVSVSLMLTPLEKVGTREGVEAFVEGLLLASYGYHAYHKKHADKHAKTAIRSVTFFEERKPSLVAYEKAMFEAGVLAEATCFTRDLVNTPSEDMFPLRMAEIAKVLAASSKEISVKFLDKDRMHRLKMNAALAVARGS